MSRRPLASLFTLLLILTCLATASVAQTRIPKQYQKKDRSSINPMTISLQLGWGFLAGAPEMRPVFSGTQNTTYGGPQLAFQVLTPMDFIWDHLTIGVDGWYHRIAKRYMGDVDPKKVYYTATKEYVPLDETVSGFGLNAIFDVLVAKWLHIQLGGGGVLLYPHPVNTTQEITGLTPRTLEPTAFAGLDLVLVSYERGSVDIYIKGIRQFGKYNNYYAHADLGFSFRL